MAAFRGKIERMTRENDDFRREVATNRHSQVVLMCVQPGEDVGEEVHEHVDQVLIFVEGEASAVLDGEARPVEAGGMVVVPAGSRHNFVNTGKVPLKLYTVYAPPEHPAGTVHRTRAEAMEAEAQEQH